MSVYNIRRQQNPALMADSGLLDVTVLALTNPLKAAIITSIHIMGQIQSLNTKSYNITHSIKFTLLMEYSE